MAIFKTPRISKSERETLTLDASELVYDTTVNMFYGGNGISLGGFPVGLGAGSYSETIEITQNIIDNKSVELSQIPLYPNNVSLLPLGGIYQRNGIDFEVNANVVSWNGLGLDGFLELGDTIVIEH